MATVSHSSWWKLSLWGILVLISPNLTQGARSLVIHEFRECPALCTVQTSFFIPTGDSSKLLSAAFLSRRPRCSGSASGCMQNTLDPFKSTWAYLAECFPNVHSPNPDDHFNANRKENVLCQYFISSWGNGDFRFKGKAGFFWEMVYWRRRWHFGFMTHIFQG